MHEPFAVLLAEGGKSNSLGRSAEVIEAVLQDRALLGELYGCLFDSDSWIRMRAADSLEKVCRPHPEWLLPYVDRFMSELHASTQPSIQWHLAQIYQQVALTPAQRQAVIAWLTDLLKSVEVDWIVAANAMDALAYFAREGYVAVSDARAIFEVQMGHKSKAVVKRAQKLLDELGS